MPSLRSLARRKPRVAFVLSGGGNLGALQVGMLKALTERQIVPDVVLGCSVGAMNGAAYALAPGAAGVRRLEDHWSHSSYRFMPSSRLPSVVQLIRKGASLHSNDGLRQSLESLLGVDRRFEDLAVPFECVAAEIDGATEEWFADGPLVAPILASAALPAVFPAVTIHGRRYVDGGVVNNVPVSRALELGCRQIYILHVGRHGRPDATVRRPIDAALQAYWVARNSRFARDLAALPDGVEAIILPPGRRPELRYDDFSQTEDLVRQGHERSASFLDERATTVTERTRTAELLRPLERWKVSARAQRWFQEAEQAAEDPAGAVLTAPPSHEPDGVDGGDGAVEAAGSDL